MQNVFLRFLISLLIFSAGMGVVCISLQSEGAASQNNPAWLIASGFLKFEWVILQGLALMVALALGAFALYLIIEWLKRPSKQQVEEENRQEELREMQRTIEYERHESERLAEIHRQRAKEEKERADEKESRRLKFQNRTPEEKKRDALNELTKGW